MEYRVLDVRIFGETEYNATFERLPLWRQEKAQKLRNDKDRKLSVFAFSLALSMLSDYLHKDEKEIEIYPDGKGKLRVRGEKVSFSISHSYPFVSCAVSKGEVGVDMECPREISQGVMRRSLCEEELSFVLSDEPLEDKLSDGQTRRFLKIWTMKEAYLKFTGEGLSGGLQSVKTINEKGEISLNKGSIKSLCEEKESYTLSLVWQE